MRRPHLPGRFQTLSREEQHASLASRSRKICTQVKNPNELGNLALERLFHSIEANDCDVDLDIL